MRRTASHGNEPLRLNKLKKKSNCLKRSFSVSSFSQEGRGGRLHYDRGVCRNEKKCKRRKLRAAKAAGSMAASSPGTSFWEKAY